MNKCDLALHTALFFFAAVGWSLSPDPHLSLFLQNSHPHLTRVARLSQTVTDTSVACNSTPEYTQLSLHQGYWVEVWSHSIK